jgi:hypothetical protein
MKKEKCAASITIHDAADMTPKGKKEIAEWLRKQAKMLLKEGDNYPTRFRASYLYI